MKSQHAAILNALDVMQGSVIYAARRDILQQAECIIVSQENALAEKDEEIARLRLEAQSHAQEARTANATIAEIYQVVSGATGEPGNWHGAEPVRTHLAQLQAELDRVMGENKELRRHLEMEGLEL